MLDIVFIAAGTVLFIATAWYARICERL